MPAADGKAYTGFHRTLHWITALGVLSMVPAGLVMGWLGPGPVQNFLFDYHRSVGVTLFVLTVIRLGWRLTHPPAPLPSDIPTWQRLLATGVHYALYAILLVNPLLGWVATSAYRAPIFVFWLFELPPIVEENRPFSEALFEVHQIIGLTATALVCLHIAGALYHHFVRKDQVLLRMVTG